MREVIARRAPSDPTQWDFMEWKAMSMLLDALEAREIWGIDDHRWWDRFKRG